MFYFVRDVIAISFLQGLNRLPLSSVFKINHDEIKNDYFVE